MTPGVVTARVLVLVKLFLPPGKLVVLELKESKEYFFVLTDNY